MVVSSHLFYLLDSTNSLFISISGIFGYFGVELFFVLSGFLIGTILLKQFLENSFTVKSVFTFLKRRWFKTLPNYYLIFVVNLIIAMIFNFEINNFGNYFLFLQNFSKYQITFFTESWSLSVEEWAYFVIPIFLFFAWKVKFINRKISFIACVFFLIFIFYLLRYINFLQNPISDINLWNTNIKSLVIYRIDSILFGFVLSWLVYYFGAILNKYRVYLLIIAAHLFLFQFVIMNVIGFEITRATLYYNVYYFWLTSFTAALSMPFFIFWKKSPYLNNIILFLSKTSYSVYLLHYSVITILFKFLFNGMIVNPVLIVVCYLVITFSLSYILYRFYEKPLMNLRDKQVLKDKSLS